MGNSAFSQNTFGSNSTIVDETPGGSINDSNTAFTTANNYVAGSLAVYINGVRQEGGGADFTEDGGNDFTMTTAPTTGDDMIVDYLQSVTNRGNADTVDGYHGSELLDPKNFTEGVAFSVGLGSTQNVSHNVQTKVELDTEDFDYGNDFNTSTHVFTAPYDGIYYFTGAALLDDLDDNDWFILFLQGSGTSPSYVRVRDWAVASGNQMEPNVSGIFHMDAGDTMQLDAFHQQGATQVLQGTTQRTRMSGFLLWRV